MKAVALFHHRVDGSANQTIELAAKFFEHEVAKLERMRALQILPASFPT
jgi:hypothetical protein